MKHTKTGISILIPVNDWCGRRDSNSHTLRHWNLNPACLPIPPLPLTVLPRSTQNTVFFRPPETPGQPLNWGGRRGSNPRPPESQSGALPTELRPPVTVRKTIQIKPKNQAKDRINGHLKNGAPGRIRTCDHPLRRRMLYPTELRALNHLFDWSG